MNLYETDTHEEVDLPADLRTFRGVEIRVLRIAEDASPGRSGKVETDEGRLFYPSVFGCYIDKEARA